MLVVVLAIAAGNAGAQSLRLEPVTIAATGITATMLEIPLDGESLSVLAVSTLSKGYGSIDANLEGIGKALATRLGTRDFALLSAGFNREDPLNPTGLLIERGRSISPLALSKRNVAGLGARYTQSGVLCVSEAGAPRVLYVEEYQRERAECFWAVQAGPIVIERDGSDAISPAQVSAANRLIACEPSNGNRSFAFYYFEQAKLRDVERSLRGRCAIALNLAGASQAGMTLWREGRLMGVQGSSSTPLPSMILVAPKVSAMSKRKK